MKTKLAFVLLLVTMLFSSCSKEKTYSIQNAYTHSGDYYGSLIVYEYAEAGDCVKAFNTTIKAGRKDTFTANDRAVKVKLYNRNSSRWVQQVYYLEKGNTNISIHDDLIYGYDEP